MANPQLEGGGPRVLFGTQECPVPSVTGCVLVPGALSIYGNELDLMHLARSQN